MAKLPETAFLLLVFWNTRIFTLPRRPSPDKTHATKTPWLESQKKETDPVESKKIERILQKATKNHPEKQYQERKLPFKTHQKYPKMALEAILWVSPAAESWEVSTSEVRGSCEGLGETGRGPAWAGASSGWDGWTSPKSRRTLIQGAS